MKIFLLLFFYSAYIVSVRAQEIVIPNKFTLAGKVIGEDIGYIRIRYIDISGKQVCDTTKIDRGTFIFSGFIKEPTHAYITSNIKSFRIQSDDPNTAEMFLEPKLMKVVLEKGNLKHAIITGSKTQDEWEKLKREEEFSDKQTASNNGLREMEYNFVLKHPGSFLGPYLILSYFPVLSLDSLKVFYNNWLPLVENSFDGTMVKNEIQKREWTEIGSVAQDFSSEDINGREISLSSFRDKSYVLLDFWASWCVPCRELFPQLKKLYLKYHSKGFSIIGISYDANNSAWANAIHHDGIGMWRQVLIAKNLMQPPTANDILSKYEVNGIPTEILIDKKGVIIGVWSGQGDEELNPLAKELQKIFR